MKRCEICKTELFFKRGTPKTVIKYCRDCYIELSKIRALARYYKNRVKLLAYQNEYNKLHRVKILNYVKQYNRNKKLNSKI